MKSTLLLALLGISSLAVAGPGGSERPKITNIDHVAFYTTAPDGVTHLYHDVMGLASASPFEPGETLRFIVGTQWVGYSPAPDPQALSRMDHVAFRRPLCSSQDTGGPGSRTPASAAGRAGPDKGWLDARSLRAQQRARPGRHRHHPSVR